jgi:thiol-disulfide isomerase/thioredoxin
MTRVCLPFLFLLCATALADDKPTTPAEKLAAIKKQHEEAEAAFRKAGQALGDTADDQKKYEELYKAFDKGQAERFIAAFEIAKAGPKSDAGFAALEWVLTTPRAYQLPVGKPALELAAEHHATNPKVGKAAAWVAYFLRDERAESHAPGMAFLKAVAEKNPDRTARGQAVMAAAWRAKWKFDAAEYRKAADAEALAAAAEKAFEAVVKDYADCPRLMRDGQPTLGAEAKQELFELQHLRIGKTAPDIAAEGVDGKKFKLSDYRGKVAVVNFWASWCGPCMAMVPHERELVERLKDKPFVLVGVNGDETRDKAKEVMAKEKMTWPSFWNGPRDDEKAISRAWNVRGWPTVYVLDAKGVIRYKGVRGKELDKAVDGLLKELDAKGNE